MAASGVRYYRWPGIGVLPGMLLWACSVRAESPSTPMPLDQARVIYVCEPETELIRNPDGSVWIDREIQPKHDGCRERYARRELPFPVRRLRSTDQAGPLLPHEAGLRGVDRRGRSWFLHCDHKSDDSVSLQLERNDAGMVTQWRLAGGYSDNSSLQKPPWRWPWVGADMLVDTEGIVWVVGAKHLYRFAADAQAGDRPEAIPFPVPDEPGQAENLVGRGRYWNQQVYRLADAIWVVREFAGNAHRPGAFVMRFIGSKSSIVAWLPGQYVRGLVLHAGTVYLLVEEGSSHGIKVETKPAAILRVGDESRLPRQPEETIREKIADLNSEFWLVRDEASDFLAALPGEQLEWLRKAMEKPLGADQKRRLRLALESAVARCKTVAPATLAEASAGRVLLIDDRGRQYVQPYRNGAFQREILVFNGRTCQRVEWPSERLTLDCPDDDCLYGHTPETLYRLRMLPEPAAANPAEPSGDPVETGVFGWQPVASLDGLAGHEVRVLTAWKGLVCLSIKVQHLYDSSVWMPAWLDFSTADPVPPLPGRPLADGIALESNVASEFPVAVGPGDRLWFLRYDHGKYDERTLKPIEVETTQIGRAIGGKVENLTGKLPSGVKPSVWPIGPDTAIVVTAWSHDRPEQVLFYDQGKTTTHPTLVELVKTHHQRLQARMADGTAFRVGDDHDPICLVRLGDSFYVHEARFRHVGNASGMWTITCIVRDGQSAQRAEGFSGRGNILVERLVGFDARTRRLLGFVGDYKTLQWIPLASDAAPSGGVHGESRSWAWFWQDRTALPRFAGAWTLTPEAVKHFLAVEPRRVESARRRGVSSPEVFPDYQSADLPAWRRWNGGQWRTLDQSLYGGSIWEDAAGCSWVFHEREVEITFPDDRRQLIPLDAGTHQQFHLTIESPGAVWVASQQSLKRFRLDRDAQGKPAQWKHIRTFRLPCLGVGFVGPWIVGKDFYYICNQRMFHTTLEELNGQPSGSTPESAGQNPAKQRGLGPVNQ